MKVIGLTGGVGTGKTTVARLLEREFGAYLILTDEIAKEMMEPGGISYQLVTEYFGPTVVGTDGKINRTKLAQIVFADKEKLKLLNSFSHPFVKEYVLNEIEKIKNMQSHSMIIVETALLIEAGYMSFCDEVWVVTASLNNRRDRLKLSRGYTDEKIDSILQSQVSEDAYLQCAKQVIVNDEGESQIREQITKMIATK